MIPTKDLTLILIDTDNHQLAALALEDTLNQISPYEVHVWTDGGDEFFRLNPSIHPILPIRSIHDYNEVLWFQVPDHIQSSHALILQWDGWVVNADAWSDEFTLYDYIGAVWPWHRDGNRIGNGGFSLRSRRLMKFLQENILPSDQEDDTICRAHRQELEYSGFKWPAEKVAKQFSHEHPIIRQSRKPFGFHDVRNWYWIMDEKELQTRISLCDQIPYISKKPEYKQLKTIVSAR